MAKASMRSAFRKSRLSGTLEVTVRNFPINIDTSIASHGRVKSLSVSKFAVVS